MMPAQSRKREVVRRFHGRLIGAEVGRFLLIFLIASFGLFLALEAMPGDPVSLRVKNPDPARIEEIRDTLGLNDPWVVRYIRSVGDFLTLDWGDSLISGRSVRDEIGRFFPATLELAVLGILIGVSMSVFLVLFSHATGWTWLLQPIRGLSAMGLTVPIFWIGLLLILIFGVFLEVLPVGGRFNYMYLPPGGTGFMTIDSLLSGDFQAFWISCRHLVLPVLTLSLYPAAVVAGTLEGRLGEDSMNRLVTALRSRGISSIRIWGLHVLRIVSAPVVTVVGTQAGALLGGAVLTETVYSWPGMGRFLVDAVLNRDVFAIQNGLLMVVVLALVMVTLSDLLAKMLDHQLAVTGGDDDA